MVPKLFSDTNPRLSSNFEVLILMIYADKHALLGSRGNTFTGIYKHLVTGDKAGGGSKSQGSVYAPK